MASLSRGDFEGARRVGERLRAGGARRGRRRCAPSRATTCSGWSPSGRASSRPPGGTSRRPSTSYRPERRSDRLARYGTTTEVLSTSRLGNTLGFLGRPEAAAGARDAALARATGERAAPQPRGRAGVRRRCWPWSCATRRRSGPTAPSWPPGPGDLARPSRVVADALAGYVEVLDGQDGGRHRPHPARPGGRRPRTTTPPACTPWSRGCSWRPAWSPATPGPAWSPPTGPSASTATSAPGSRRPAAAGPSSWPRSAPPPTRSRPSSGARSRSPAARAPGCSSCGPRPACSATGSTPATTARRRRARERLRARPRHPPRGRRHPRPARGGRAPGPRLSGNAPRNAPGTPRRRSCSPSSERRPR